MTLRILLKPTTVLHNDFGALDVRICLLFLFLEEIQTVKRFQVSGRQFVSQKRRVYLFTFAI